MDPQSKFKNESGGVAGAIKLDHEGHAKGIAVFPNESVWLTEKEEVLTANAPRNEADNPFTNGTFRCEVKAAEAGHSRPIGSRMDESPAAPELPPEAAEGDPESIDLRVETGAANDPPRQPPAPPAPAIVPQPPTEPAAPPVQDPDSAESLAPKEAPAPPVTPEPKPGQSKRDARAEAPAAKAQPKPAAPTPAPAPAPAAAPKPAPSE